MSEYRASLDPAVSASLGLNRQAVRALRRSGIPPSGPSAVPVLGLRIGQSGMATLPSSVALLLDATVVPGIARPGALTRPVNRVELRLRVRGTLRRCRS